MSFLILHGWQNRRPEGHWQHWLADQLAGLGRLVAYPQLPAPDEPDLERWLRELERSVKAMPGPERVVICHSLSCLLWLHALARGIRLPVDRVLLVAPPSPEVIAQIPAIADFVPPPVTPEHFTVPTLIVAGDADPYCPEGAGRRYAEPLGLELGIINGGGHLDLDEAGYGPWPGVLYWCLDPEIRLGRGAAGPATQYRQIGRSHQCPGAP